MECRAAPVLFLVLLCRLQAPVLGSGGAPSSATFTFSNNCRYTVWPGILSGSTPSPLATTGFVLPKGEARSVPVPAGWSGRLWARTGCSDEPATGKFACETGDCGSGAVECSGGADPPATLAEFTLDGGGGMDFYDVSLVDGFNLPVLVVPEGGRGRGGNTTCVATGCLAELNGVCPSELRVVAAAAEGGGAVACRSACEAFKSPEYCCEGAYANPNTCRPSSYSQFFKNACPRAYSYAYDDGTSIFTCPGGTSYHVTFCPTVAMLKSADENPQPEAVPIPHMAQIGGGAMIYQGALVASRGGRAGASLLATAASLAVLPVRLLL